MEKRKVIFTLLILVFLNINTFLIEDATASRTISYALSDGVKQNFTIRLNQVIGTVNPLFWGANFLFWIEDDEALLDGKIEESLKKLPVKSLRYPGGTVADNFHWKTNMLENKFRFPYQEGESETDFDVFMAFCMRVGAEPVLVVNTESWQIKQDLDSGIQEATEWVQYCKDKGYKVKYWEIGNETYWHPFFTAREYGQAVKRYVQAMKAVDPTINISANGHWDVNMVGTKERTNQSQWETIRQMYLNIASKTDTEAADAYADSFKDTDIRNGTEKWWSIVADECGAYIDMISVHWYFSGSTNMGSMTENLNQIRQLFKSKYPDKNYTLCMTEYNCNHNDHKLAISGMFDGIGRFLNAGVEIANFWPLRNSVDGNRRSMMHINTKEEGYAYQVLQLMGNNLKGDMLQTVSDKQIFPVVTYDGKQLTVLISGRAISAQSVDATMFLLEMEQFTLIDAKVYDAPAMNTVPIRLIENDLPVSVSGSSCSFSIVPVQTAILNFINNQYLAVNEISADLEISVNTEGEYICVKADDWLKVSVYNMQGVRIAQQEGMKEISIKIKDRGIYIVKTSFSENGTQMKKIFF